MQGAPIFVLGDFGVLVYLDMTNLLCKVDKTNLPS